jgi:hypothetical protein
MARPLTRYQAAAFIARTGERDRGAEFDDMTVHEYAEHRGFELVGNPSRKTRKQNMAGKNEQQG